MILKWIRRRRTRNLQKMCPHDYSVTVSYRKETYNGNDIDFHDAFDLYCPMCDKELAGVGRLEKNHIINRQKILKQYEKNKRENGEDVDVI